MTDPLVAIAASPPGPQIGAFFDLDGTLVRGFTATVHAGHRIRNRQSGFGELSGILEASVRYKLGRMEFARLLQRAAGYLAGDALADLEALGEDLFNARIIGRLFPVMTEVVAAHQQRGHTVVMSSSALTMHAGPVARHLGIEHVLCNHFEVDDAGKLTGRIVRPIIWGGQKARAVMEFSSERDIDLAGSFCYADGTEDLPVLNAVGHPNAVNPRPGLATAAARNGWPILRVSPEADRRWWSRDQRSGTR
ncbi:HAD family hydrolase [Mycolicibacterium diernhoferi]|uniref:HAD-IB family hydrolase n=1 Tax=Mycolicibacterium diernhoferi TaxID=1801 RepID=A0A1Q4H760_9MYCO|nr:HAD-IB family hydrolase [Mycolicibacterium diernhoferi]OJZ63358.1 haloacid dehalogenase [Mycolicibacterium diernhoferi]OPE48112.1 haloacid dehalogenase [Mycolicibacterium diernhoferi]PEG54064.1 HAD-IB family hydrolase [Mycolicibacterium diernhoferi]QYL20498.1 HAD-IB family hydrolase [Mycolicibacterium diernhoferi]